MQLTNILRDVREDRERGRVYLPAEDLRAVRLRRTRSRAARGVAELIRFEADASRASGSTAGSSSSTLLDRRSASCVLAMTGIYRAFSTGSRASPTEVLQRRISLPAWEKAWVAARSLAAAADRNAQPSGWRHDAG